jgi:hypothetical protein
MPAMLSRLLQNAAEAAGLVGGRTAWKGSAAVAAEDAARVQAVLAQLQQDEEQQKRAVESAHMAQPEQLLQMRVYVPHVYGSESQAAEGAIGLGITAQQLQSLLAAVEAWHSGSQAQAGAAGAPALALG